MISYKGILFSTDLEARWAVFFDLVGWQWLYHPMPVKGGWRPTFLVSFPCGHSECPPDGHSLFVEVQPFSSLDSFKGHHGLRFPYGYDEDSDCWLGASASAVFGDHPDVTYWEMGHGSGGGEECVSSWVTNEDACWPWDRAGEVVRRLASAHASG